VSLLHLVSFVHYNLVAVMTRDKTSGMRSNQYSWAGGKQERQFA